jgi:dimethylhistidine N-methyltransferase
MARLAARAPHAATSPEFAAVVRDGLAASPKRLPPKYFYDALGSALFDAISELPWYEITRAEHRLLVRHAPAIAGTAATLVDLGCGTAEKTAVLARAVVERGGRPRLHLVDVSPAALDGARRRLEAIRGVTITTHEAEWLEGLTSAARLGTADTMLVAFFGSNIGNLEPAAAHAFLGAVRAQLRPADHLLLGTDLVKPAHVLEAAYDDPLGVTACFNRNVLLRINRELGADFDLARFQHRAVWNADASRVEMHLVSRARHTVAIPGAGCVVRFDLGEPVVTEHSYKYRPGDVLGMGRAAGFAPVMQWIERRARFALTLLAAA